MKQYEPIGKYIHLTDTRNNDMAVTNLVGLTIEKKYIPSVANVIGTDLSKYKVIKQGQFACSLMQVSRDGKMPVAMYKGEPAIMSPAYPVFEVNDINELMPEYLHMYLSRQEFDREAVFRAVGGVRGSLDWEDFLAMKMPVPDIDEQRKIVAEYQAVEQRIENNNRLIKALEDTAQAIYHHTFVENIDPENLPEGWSVGYLYDLGKFTNGLACQNFEGNGSKQIPVLKIRELNQGFADSTSDRVDDTFPQSHIVKSGDLIFSWSATLMVKFWSSDNIALNQHLFKVTSNVYPLWFLYFGIKQHIAAWKNLISAKATSMGHIKIEDLQRATVHIPKPQLLETLDKEINPIIKLMILAEQENLKLSKAKNLLLSKLS